MWIADAEMDGLLQALADANARADRAEQERDDARRWAVRLDCRWAALREGALGPYHDERVRRSERRKA